MDNKREKLGSRLGFILLSAGCAIGCGNVWKFPWMTGQFGGGGFVLVYILCLLLLGATSVYVLYLWRKPVGRRMPFFAVYVASLVMMCVCAIGCFPVHGIAGILIAAGGALFYISDFFLFRRLLFPADRIVSWIIMITYYAALLLFGISCLML